MSALVYAIEKRRTKVTLGCDAISLDSYKQFLSMDTGNATRALSLSLSLSLYIYIYIYNTNTLSVLFQKSYLQVSRSIFSPQCLLRRMPLFLGSSQEMILAHSPIEVRWLDHTDSLRAQMEAKETIAREELL